MRIVPKEIDPKVKERCVSLVLDHLQELLDLDRGCRGGGAA